MGHLGCKLQLLDLVFTRATKLQVLSVHIGARCPLRWRWWFCVLVSWVVVELTVALKERGLRILEARRWILLLRRLRLWR